jgi:hypothetical protein
VSEKIKDILEHRQEIYGDAEQNFIAIGRIWGALLNVPDIQPHVVSLMMDGLKSVRCIANPLYQDSWDDKIGYIQHAREILNGS